jgi:hypothetical protein
MSTHLHNPLAEKTESIETAFGFLLAGALGLVLWALIIGGIALCIQGVTAALQSIGLLP